METSFQVPMPREASLETARMDPDVLGLTIPKQVITCVDEELQGGRNLGQTERDHAKTLYENT